MNLSTDDTMNAVLQWKIILIIHESVSAFLIIDVLQG